MGGGLMQLVAYGAQDVYLTGNPQITFEIDLQNTLTLLWNLLNKLSMDKQFWKTYNILSPEMVILLTDTYKLHFQK